MASAAFPSGLMARSESWFNWTSGRFPADCVSCAIFCDSAQNERNRAIKPWRNIRWSLHKTAGARIIPCRPRHGNSGGALQGGGGSGGLCLAPEMPGGLPAARKVTLTLPDPFAWFGQHRLIAALLSDPAACVLLIDSAGRIPAPRRPMAAPARCRARCLRPPARHRCRRPARRRGGTPRPDAQDQSA